jgi:hypothetical protein
MTIHRSVVREYDVLTIESREDGTVYFARRIVNTRKERSPIWGLHYTLNGAGAFCVPLEHISQSSTKVRKLWLLMDRSKQHTDLRSSKEK